MFQRVIWGEITNPHNESLMDINGRERLTLLPLMILIVWMGVYSNHFLRPMDTSVTNLLSRVENSQGNDVRTAERIAR
jgi:NADH-quinone oxidoreductase subunit M